MNHPDRTLDSGSPEPSFSLATWTLFPAVAMLLGWGLRGYIGGGPFGALIPGAYVGLCFSMLLGHGIARGAVVACLSAVAIGYGGEMTYGQTLGLAKEVDTRAWGFLGVTIKGAVWGLLGGAVIGAALVARPARRLGLELAIAATPPAFFLGWKLINDPKLVYFSNPLDKPREESWAGLLFAAVAFLAVHALAARRREAECAPTEETAARAFLSRMTVERVRAPLVFALIGAAGGAAGFGGGTIWLVYGPEIPVEQKWWGWWKMMEFSFGAALGAALGLAGWLERANLLAASRADRIPGGGGFDDRARESILRALVPLGGLVGITALFFALEPKVFSGDTPPGPFVRNLGRMLLTFVAFGGACAIGGLRSRAVAWQVAITLTFWHTILDLNEDVFGERLFAEAPRWASHLTMVATTGGVAWLTHRLARGPHHAHDLLLLAVWSCMATGTARAMLLESGPSMATTYGIFLASAVGTSAFAIGIDRARARRAASPSPADHA